MHPSFLGSNTLSTDGELIQRFEDHNYMAAILSTRRGEAGRFVCGATIISEDKILSAAHCVVDRYSIDLIIGAANLNGLHHTVKVNQSEIIIHPAYELNGNHSLCSYVNDIAVIQLKEPLVFSRMVGKIDMVLGRSKVDKDLENEPEHVKMLGYPDNRLRSINSTIADSGCFFSYW